MSGHAVPTYAPHTTCSSPTISMLPQSRQSCWYLMIRLFVPSTSLTCKSKPEVDCLAFRRCFFDVVHTATTSLACNGELELVLCGVLMPFAPPPATASLRWFLWHFDAVCTHYKTQDREIFQVEELGRRVSFSRLTGDKIQLTQVFLV